MGRPRIRNRDLPTRMRLQDGIYYFRPKEGRSIRLGKDRAEALRKYFKLVTVQRPLTTLGAIMDRYLIEVIPTKAPRTQLDNQREIGNLRASFGHFEPDAITAQDIYTYLDGRVGKVRANREIALLSHIYKKAVRWGAATHNPCVRAEVERNPETPRDRYVSDKELEFFKKHASPMIQAYCDFKYLSGMRKGDILTLTKAALKDDGVHYVPRKTRRRDPKTGERKGRARVILWSPDLREVVERILAIRGRRRVRVAGKRQPAVPTIYLFASINGQPYYKEAKGKADGFDAIWKRYMAKAKAAAAAAAATEGWTLARLSQPAIDFERNRAGA